MVFWALLPLFLFIFIRGVNKKDVTYALVISLLTAIFSYAIASVVFNLLLWFTFFLISTFFFVFQKKDRYFLIKYFTFGIAGFILFNIWWISQVFSFASSSGYSSSVSTFFSPLDNINTLNALSNLLGKITYSTVSK